MTNMDNLLLELKKHINKDCLVHKNITYSYSWLIDRTNNWIKELKSENITNTVIAFKGDFSPNTISLFLALISTNNVVVPLGENQGYDIKHFSELADINYFISLEPDEHWNIINLQKGIKNPILTDLIKKNKAGIIVFTSGSTGKPKAILHDAERVLNRYHKKSKSFTTICFLSLDHFGGINTFLYQLMNGGKIVFTEKRNPKEICELIERHSVDLLPVTPTFLKLLLVSEEYKNYNIESLKIISYGTEVMPASTLARLNQILPNVKLKQTYGLSELGVFPTKSENSNSNWIKIGGNEDRVKVVDNQLFIKSSSSMLGYLNENSPFDNEGWFNTEDIVEVKDGYYKILGRKSDIINVGGQKVFPQEVENVLNNIDVFSEVEVIGEKNPIMGQIVCAIVSHEGSLSRDEARKIIHSYCKGKLPNYKIPVKVYFEKGKLHNSRFKKIRTQQMQ